MIQHATANDFPVYLPQLSAARPRGGMRKLGELVDCLIQTYEAQARVLDAYSTKAAGTSSSSPTNPADRRERTHSRPKPAERQATFEWYQNGRSGR